MDQEKLTTDLNKEIERDLGVKLPPPARPVATNGNGQAQAPRLTHAARPGAVKHFQRGRRPSQVCCNAA